MNPRRGSTHVFDFGLDHSVCASCGRPSNTGCPNFGNIADVKLDERFDRFASISAGYNSVCAQIVRRG